METQHDQFTQSVGAALVSLTILIIVLGIGRSCKNPADGRIFRWVAVIPAFSMVSWVIVAIVKFNG